MVKWLVLELGGYVFFIVFVDCDLDLVVDEVIKVKFVILGQDCLGVNCFLVECGIYDDFCVWFVKVICVLMLGFGIEDCDFGFLMNEVVVKKQEEQVVDVLVCGVWLLIGGSCDLQGLLFYQFIVLVDVLFEVWIFYEEIFGLVVVIVFFDIEDQVVVIVNVSEYGLVVYVYFCDLCCIYWLLCVL